MVSLLTNLLHLPVAKKVAAAAAGAAAVCCGGWHHTSCLVLHLIMCHSPTAWWKVERCWCAWTGLLLSMHCFCVPFPDIVFCSLLPDQLHAPIAVQVSTCPLQPHRRGSAQRHTAGSDKLRPEAGCCEPPTSPQAVLLMTDMSNVPPQLLLIQ